MTRKVRTGIGGNDADGRANQIHWKRSVRFGEVHDHSSGIGSFNGRQQEKGAALGRFVCGIGDEVERAFHVSRSERAAIVEANTTMQVEHISDQIRRFLRFGEVAAEIHLIVALKQAAEQESIDALRLRISGKARVEIGGLDSMRNVSKKGSL